MRIPTFTSLVPAQLTRLLDAAEHDSTVHAALRSFETILVGGQALPPHRRSSAPRAAGARIVRTYGSTETSGGCVYDGVPLRGVSVRIVEGEVQIAGADARRRLPRGSEMTDAVFRRTPEGTRWYRTGDAGLIEDDVLRVRGRIDNVIVSGGVNISLDRVERVVRAIPGLESAVVVGVPDPTVGRGIRRRRSPRRGASPERVRAARRGQASRVERDRAACAAEPARAGRRSRHTAERQARSRGDPLSGGRAALNPPQSKTWSGPVCTTQNRLPSVSSSTTQSASSG